MAATPWDPAINQSVIQLDIPRYNAKVGVLPKHLPGRVNVDDFIFFNLPQGLNSKDYMVVIDSLDTAGPSRKSIGYLSQSGGSVELPHVRLDAYAQLYVIPATNARLPSFQARLNRGSTYTIPNVMNIHRPGSLPYQMQRHGMLTAGCDASDLAY